MKSVVIVTIGLVSLVTTWVLGFSLASVVGMGIGLLVCIWKPQLVTSGARPKEV